MLQVVEQPARSPPATVAPRPTAVDLLDPLHGPLRVLLADERLVALPQQALEARDHPRHGGVARGALEREDLGREGDGREATRPALRGRDRLRLANGLAHRASTRAGGLSINRATPRRARRSTRRSRTTSRSAPSAMRASRSSCSGPSGRWKRVLFSVEPAWHPRRVRADLDAGPDLGQGRRLLIDLDVEPGAQQRECRGQPADAAADDADPHDRPSVAASGPRRFTRRG